MNTFVAVAIGGAVGALARFGCSSALATTFGRSFPYGTLFVNVIGSAVLGTLFVVLVERASAAQEWRALLMTGMLGAFTTFSTFSLETLALIEQGASGRALANVALNVGGCLGACALGIWAARSV